MRKRIILTIVLLVLIGGCGAPITQDNPLGISDPNQVQQWINFGHSLGQTVQAAGTATGNPALIGYGAAITIISGYLATIILKKDKKNGES